MTLCLLHLSDLHFGAKNRFVGKADPVAFADGVTGALGQLAPKKGVDLIVVSGDLTETAAKREFLQAKDFLLVLGRKLGLEPTRFVFVPGNHDVSWRACELAVAEYMVEEPEPVDQAELRRRMNQKKLGRYYDFLQDFYGAGGAGQRTPLERDGYLYWFKDLRLCVAALNSCEQESHQKGDHLGQISAEQSQALMEAWRQKEATGWLKLIVLHHPPDLAAPAVIDEWRAYLKAHAITDEVIDRYVADVTGLRGADGLKAVVRDTEVQLVLHGHQHATEDRSWRWNQRGSALVLSAGSWGAPDKELPGDEPNAVRLIVMDPAKKELRARALVWDPRARQEGSVRAGAFVRGQGDSDDVHQTLHLSSGWAPEQSAKDVVSGADFLAEYRRCLRGLWERWELGPVGVTQPGTAGRPIVATLDRMYLPLRLHEGFAPETTDQGKPLTPADVRRLKAPVIIRGAAGSGKTTWMRWTFRRLLDDPKAVPVPVVLREVARRWQEKDCHGEARSLEHHLEDWLAQYLPAWKDRLTPLMAQAQGRGFVLLVDGWDELGSLGDEFRQQMRSFLMRHPHLKVVASSRPYGQGQPTAVTEGFQVLHIQPLADKEMQLFAKTFFAVCYGQDQRAADAEVTHFWQAITRSPDALALGRTALLLTMMLLISRSRPLPDKRHQLYEACIENLLNDLPKQRETGGAQAVEEHWRPPDGEERMRVVAELALKMQEAGYKKVKRAAIVLKWDEMAAMLPDDWDKRKKHGFLAWLAGPSGLLTDRSDDTLTFAHLSFQEYLSAWRLNTTVPGTAEARTAEFQQRMSDTDWWETLRLWAALLGRANQDWLDAVMRRLFRNEQGGAALVGSVLADGLGSETLMKEWLKTVQVELRHQWPLQFDLCCTAWHASRQHGRRQELAAGLMDGSANAPWPERLRRQDSLATVDESRTLELPGSGSLAASLELALSGDLTRSALAVGRVLCGGPALWPGEPVEVALLQVWPNDRRMLGMSLESAALGGATRRDLVKVYPSLVRRQEDARALSGRRELVRDLVRDLAWDLAQDFARGSGLDTLLDLAWDLARDFAQHFARDFARELARESMRDLVRALARYLARDFARESARNFARYFARDLARNFSRHFARDVVREVAQYVVRDLAGEFVTDSKPIPPPWLTFMAHSDIVSFGRAGARVALAHCANEGSPSPQGRLLAQAARASCKGKKFIPSKIPQGLDPLWPALGRHIARTSAPADRALLEDLARRPEQRQGPLAWGLQFIVRGDVLLYDGTVVTLDELADEASQPRLPYLDDMPPELELGGLGEEIRANLRAIGRLSPRTKILK